MQAMHLIFDPSNCEVQRLWKAMHQWISFWFWYRILRLFADHSARDGVWHGGGLYKIDSWETCWRGGHVYGTWSFNISKSANVWNQQSYHDCTNFPGAQPDIDIVCWCRSKVFSINGTFGYFQELEVRLLQSRERDIEAEAMRWFSSNRMECWWLGELDDSEVCIFEGILRIWGIIYILGMSLVNHWENFKMIQRATLRFCICFGEVPSGVIWARDGSTDESLL